MMSINSLKISKNILICPLNWGLGHACRIIPIIEYCIESNKNIVIAGNGSSLKLLLQRFPSIKNEHIPAPTLNYSRKQSIGLRFYLSFFLMFLNIYRENKFTKNVIKKYNIDTIISDNRPGIFSKKVKSIYITHQVNVFTCEKLGFISSILTKRHLRIIKKYTYCFVPDFAEKSIAGRLSENTTGLDLIYLGPLSRFSGLKSKNYNNNKVYEIVCIVSGPEPQRKVFEDILIKKFKDEKTEVLILRGLPEKQTENIQIGNICLINHCNDTDFLNYLKLSKIIICRSGYSTIMDLITIKKNAILIPTPGQPEQVYLGKHLKKYGFICVEQNDILNFNIKSLSFSEYKPINYDSQELKNILDLYL